MQTQLRIAQFSCSFLFQWKSSILRVITSLFYSFDYLNISCLFSLQWQWEDLVLGCSHWICCDDVLGCGSRMMPLPNPNSPELVHLFTNEIYSSFIDSENKKTFIIIESSFKMDGPACLPGAVF